MNQFFDLSFEQLPDGAIRLKQADGIDEASVIDLHPWQLRAVAEHFGLVHQAPPADELTKKLAEQLCRTLLAMCECYPHLPPSLEAEYSRLDAYVDLLPESIFPYHLWNEREPKAPADAVAGKPPVASAGVFALTIQEEQA